MMLRFEVFIAGSRYAGKLQFLSHLFGIFSMTRCSLFFSHVTAMFLAAAARRSPARSQEGR